MSIHITSKTKSATIRPTTKDELKVIIEQELECQGPDADLNFIDVSEIDNMECLFYRKNIRYIKIDGWDVSNVRKMHGMFCDCKYFNCDLSLWNTSNVQFMSEMFYGCSNLNCDLSRWSNNSLIYAAGMFTFCDKMTDDLKPKFM